MRSLYCAVCGELIPAPPYRLSKKQIAGRLCATHLSERSRRNGRGASQRNAEIPVSHEARQVILGSVLGDGHLEAPPQPGGHHGLAIKHGLKQESYCLWKASLLGPLVRKIDYPRERVRLRCVRHPVFSALAPVFGTRGVVTREALEELEPLALAVWYLDDGSLSRESVRSNGARDDAAIRLCTNAFPDSEQVLLRRWLEEKYKLSTTVCSWRNPRDPTSPYHGIRFYGDHARAFWALIANTVPRDIMPTKTYT